MEGYLKKVNKILNTHDNLINRTFYLYEIKKINNLMYLYIKNHRFIFSWTHDYKY